MSNIWFVASDGSGSNGSAGNSFATRWKDMSAVTAANGVVTGDTVRIMQTPAQTSLGQNAQWTDGSNVVTLTSAVNAVVSLCDTAFTAATNITCSTDTDRRQGANSASFVVGGGFTTGLMGYQTIASTNYSGYTQLTFMIKVSADVPANTIQLSLCSDTLGVTAVNSVTIAEALKAGMWTPIAIDTGATLGTAIQSVALYALLNPGTITIKLDDILTAKSPASANSLTLVSLIGKNTAGETWFGIESISGTTVTLEMDPQGGVPSSLNGYSGTTGSVTTWKKETSKTALLASGSGSNAATVTVSGITYSGGWDSAAMNTQVGDTWYDGRNGGGEGFYLSNSTNGTTLSTLAFVRYNDGIQVNASTNVTLTAVTCNNNLSSGIYSPSAPSGLSLSSTFTCANGSVGTNILAGTTGILTLSNIVANSNGSHGVVTPLITLDSVIHTGTATANRNNGNGLRLGVCNQLGTVTCNRNSAAGINYLTSVPLQITTLAAVSNTNAAIQLNAVPNIKIENFSCTGDAVDVNSQNGYFEFAICNAVVTSGLFTKNFWSGPGSRNTRDWVRFHKVAGAHTDNRIYSQAGTIVSQTGVLYPTATMTWQISPTASWLTSSFPLPLTVRTANTQSIGATTFTVSVRPTSGAINAQLRLKGGRVSGVPADVVVPANGTAGAWTDFSITATPTEIGGVLECVLETWGGASDSVYVGKVVTSQ